VRRDRVGHPAEDREQLFRDEDFAALYCPDNARVSVPSQFSGKHAITARRQDRLSKKLGVLLKMTTSAAGAISPLVFSHLRAYFSVLS